MCSQRGLHEPTIRETIFIDCEISMEVAQYLASRLADAEVSAARPFDMVQYG